MMLLYMVIYCARCGTPTIIACLYTCDENMPNQHLVALIEPMLTCASIIECTCIMLLAGKGMGGRGGAEAAGLV